MRFCMCVCLCEEFSLAMLQMPAVLTACTLWCVCQHVYSGPEHGVCVHLFEEEDPIIPNIIHRHIIITPE